MCTMEDTLLERSENLYQKLMADGRLIVKDQSEPVKIALCAEQGINVFRSQSTIGWIGLSQ